MARFARDDILLCESCGYDITSLERDLNCSECGRPIAASLPDARTGSPFQARPTPASFLATWWLTLSRPASIFSSIRIEPRISGVMLRLNLLVAGVLLSPGPWTDFARVLNRQAGLAWALNLVISIAALWLLTRVEMVGIRTFGARRGWRISPVVATAVCAHASVGWVVTGVLFLLSLTVPVPRMGVTLPPAFGAWNINVAVVLAPLSALLAGLLVFELLVYMGVRRCRYANPESPGPRGTAA
jgi:hypothetical protein